MADESTTGTIYGLIGAGITAVVSIISIWIINITKNNKDSEKEIKIAEINSKSVDYENTKIALKEALESIKELEKELHDERNLKILSEEKLKEIERKFKTVKVAFRLILVQYSINFKDDPEQLELLKEFDKIIEDDDNLK